MFVIVSGIVAVYVPASTTSSPSSSVSVSPLCMTGTVTAASEPGLATDTSRPAGTLTSSSNVMTRSVPTKRGASAPVARTGAERS